MLSFMSLIDTTNEAPQVSDYHDDIQAASAALRTTIAETEGPPLPIGAPVVIVEMRGATAVVAPVAVLTSQSTIPDKGER